MTGPLPADLQRRIDAQLATGAFKSEEDVMREAIETLERRQRGLEQLRAMIAIAEEDVANGRVGPFDRDAMKRDIRARLLREGITD
jgi:Arc/MetJ-type ribon-helix-helix transcriptional regulator